MSVTEDTSSIQSSNQSSHEILSSSDEPIIIRRNILRRNNSWIPAATYKFIIPATTHHISKSEFKLNNNNLINRKIRIVDFSHNYNYQIGSIVNFNVNNKRWKIYLIKQKIFIDCKFNCLVFLDEFETQIYHSM